MHHRDRSVSTDSVQIIAGWVALFPQERVVIAVPHNPPVCSLHCKIRQPRQQLFNIGDVPNRWTVEVD
jgi:hypothetical protein